MGILFDPAAFERAWRKLRSAEIDQAPEFVSLSLNAWGTPGARPNEAAVALALENNQ